MTAAPFEDPAKTALVERCRVAVESAAYTLAENLQRLEMPADLELRGVVQGDVQSLDGAGVRFIYVVRPGVPDKLPIWIANWARACHMMTDVRLYVVVEDHQAEFATACVKAGAGLLVINSADQFELVHDFEGNLPEDLDKEFERRARELRKTMSTKQELNLTMVKEKFSKVGTLTADFNEQMADSYKELIEREHEAWVNWGEEIGNALDDALTERSQDRLGEVEEMIIQGIPRLEDAEDVA